MKTIITLLALLCCGFYLNAQISKNGIKKVEDTTDSISKDNKKTETIKLNTKVLTLDLSQPKSQTLKSNNPDDARLVFWSKQPLQFELINGNPFRYRYVINNKVINFFEDKNNNPFTNIENVLKGVGTTPTEETIPNEEVEAKKDNIEKQIATKQAEINQSSGINNIPELRKKQDALKSLKEQLDALKNNTYNAKAAASYRFMNQLGKDVEYPTTTEEDQQIIVNALSILTPKVEGLFYRLTNDERAFKSEDDFDFTTFKEKRDDYSATYQELLSLYLSIKADSKKFTKPLSEITSNQSELDATFTKINEKIALFFNIRRDNYTMPIDVNGKNIDAVEITVKRFDSDNLIPEEFNYTIWVKGGFKIDISGGVYITTLVDKEYTTLDKTANVNGTTVSGKVIFEKEKGNFDFGFGSSVNISHRSAGWINPTLNVGALFTADQKFQLLTGLGLILGKQERIIFSSGLAMGRVNALSQNMMADGTTIYDIGTGGQIPMESIFSFGAYFGITYNFSKAKKQTTTN